METFNELISDKLPAQLAEPAGRHGVNLVVVEVEHLQLPHQAEGGRLDLGYLRKGSKCEKVSFYLIFPAFLSYLIVGQVQYLEGVEPDEGVGREEVTGDGVAGQVEEDETLQTLLIQI